MSETVHVTQHERVLVVQIDREAKRNAIDPSVTAGIGAALDRLEDDPDLWVGILTGTPACFSAGTDLRAGMSETERGGRYGVISRVRTKPLLAAVEGPALGGGMEVVLSCDLVVASTTARFGLPEVQRSLVPTCAGMFRAPVALPYNIANELLLTGDPIDAERAERLGFVNRLTAPGEALDAAIALAHRICENGPVAVRETMRVLHDLRVDDERRGWELTARGAGDLHRGGHPRGRQRLLREAPTPLDRPLTQMRPTAAHTSARSDRMRGCGTHELRVSLRGR